MNAGKIGCDYIFKNYTVKVDINMTEENKKVDKVADLMKKIKDLEHKERYSKNQMEKRALRSQIGQLQRDLVIARKEAGKK